MMKKYVLDTSLINKLVDGSVNLVELPKDGAFVATHVQLDELKRTPDKNRRRELLDKFSEVVDEVHETDTFVLGESRLGQAKLGSGLGYREIKKRLDALNGGKKNNLRDALIAEVAFRDGYVLLTADQDQSTVAQTLGIGVCYWAVGRRAAAAPGSRSGVI